LSENLSKMSACGCDRIMERTWMGNVDDPGAGAKK
jgi:hypothetical protein